MIVTINITEEQKEVLEDFLIKAQEQKLLPQILWGVDGGYNKVHILSDNATNGDIIKAMFGKPAKERKTGILYKFMYRNGKPQFSTFYDYDWWNAPYRKVEE